MLKQPTPVTLAGVREQNEENTTPKRARMSTQDRKAANTDFHHHSQDNYNYFLEELAPDDSFTVTKFRPRHTPVCCYPMLYQLNTQFSTFSWKFW